VVTNNHVIYGSDDIFLVSPGGEMMPALVVACDEDHDLAILAPEDTKWLPPALPLAKQPTRIGSKVFTVGFPRIDKFGKTPKLSVGVVSAINGLADNTSTYRLELPIHQGNSGGPLVNTNGEVVGIIASMLGAIDANGNIQTIPTVSYAIKVQFLEDILSSLSTPGPELSELPHYTDTVDGLADRIQQSVLMVVVK
jgi:S1-C subfamily serine protease